jgi:hypothetical protein
VAVFLGRDSQASPSSRPLLAPAPYLSIDRDLPAAVKDRIEEVVKNLTNEARADRCGGPGPPAPRISPRVLGHQVEVAFDFDRISQECRARELAVVVYSGKKASSTFKNFVQRYWLGGAHGRVVLDLPWSGRPPYHVIVTAATIAGRRGPAVERALRCPAGGCLPGYQPSLHSYPMPAPVLPLRGVSHAQLETSLDYALGGERQEPIVRATPRSARCASLRECTLTYADPAFPQLAYRVRYRIAGQQLRGCWMGMRGRVLDRLPFEDAFTGQLELAACVSWVR